MAIKTLNIDTKGEWEKVESLTGESLVDDAKYSIQILGVAKLNYGSTVPTTDCFTINFPQPFTYEKKSGEDLYIKTEYSNGVIFTIAG